MVWVDQNEVGPILKKLFIVYEALKVSETLSRLKEMIDVTVSIVEAIMLSKAHVTCECFGTTISGEGM